MTISNINIGDTGLEARDKINNNFAEHEAKVYLSPVAGDNTSNLNTAIAGLPAGGGIITLKGGAEYNVSGNGLNLIDGLIIEGNGAIIGRAAAMNVGKYVLEIDSDITVTLKDLTIKQERILKQSNGTLNLKKVKFSYYNIAGDAYIETSGGNIYAENLDFDSIASKGPTTCSIWGNDEMIVSGGIWIINRLRFTGTGKFRLTLDKIESIDEDYGVLYFGKYNSYHFVDNHDDWVIHNENNEIDVVLTCPFVDNIQVESHGNSYVFLNGGIYTDYWNARDNSHLKVMNCHGIAGGILPYSNAILELDGCYLKKDQGKQLLPYPDDVYNEANWGSDGFFVDHILETAEPDDLNEYNLYPVHIIRNSVLEYMGDDVLNSLDDDYLLAEIEANPIYTEDSDALPGIPPVDGTWAITTFYNEGDILLTPETWAGGVNEKYALIVMQDHTSSASVQNDMYAGKIRALFGANRQANGKYQQLIYLQTTGWYATIKPTLTYSGGKTRNRGCAFYINTNFIIENTKIIDHSCVYSTRINVAQSIGYRYMGALAYPGFNLKPITFGLIDNLTLEFRGAFNGQMKKGLSMGKPLGVEIGEFYYNNIQSVGESMNSVLCIEAWNTDYENVYKIGILKKSHEDITNAIYWPERYNTENFIVGTWNSVPPGYNFNDWVNYLCEFRNEKRDYVEYPI